MSVEERLTTHEQAGTVGVNTGARSAEPGKSMETRKQTVISEPSEEPAFCGQQQSFAAFRCKDGATEFELPCVLRVRIEDAPQLIAYVAGQVRLFERMMII